MSLFDAIAEGNLEGVHNALKNGEKPSDCVSYSFTECFFFFS